MSVKKLVLFLGISGGILFANAADLTGSWQCRSFGVDQYGGGATDLWVDTGSVAISGDGSYSGSILSQPDGETWTETGTVTDLGDGLVRVQGQEIENPADTWDIQKNINNACDFIYSVETYGVSLEEVMASGVVKTPVASSVADLEGEWRYASMWIDGYGPYWENGTVAVDSSGNFSGWFSDSDEEFDEEFGTLVKTPTGSYEVQGESGVDLALNASKDILFKCEYYPDDEEYSGEILLKKGTNYQQSDLTGKWRISSLWIDPFSDYPASAGSTVVTVGGDGTFSGISRDWDGAQVQASGTMSIDTNGVVTVSPIGDSSFHLFLNAGKNTIAGCYTDDGDLNLDIGLKAPETDSTAAWVEEGRLIKARGQFAGGVVDGKIYVFGGNESETGDNLQTIEIYNLSSNISVYGESHPSLYVEEMTGAEFVGDFFAFGAWGCADGDWGSRVRNVNVKYDPDSHSWTTLADRPDGISSAAGCAVVYGDEIFLFGGGIDGDTEGDTRTQKVHAYNPLTDTWRDVTDIPVPVETFGLARVGNLAYLIGGYNWVGNRFLTSVMTYNFETGVWDQNAGTVPSPARVFTYQHALPVINGKIYCVGGSVAESVQTDQVDVYDTASDRWQAGPDLPASTGGHCVLQNGGSIYVVGGTVAYNVTQEEDLCTDSIWRWDADGLSFLTQFFESDPVNRSYLDSAAQKYQARVDADPDDYEARVYNAVVRLANLMNDPELIDLVEQFGLTVPELLADVSGELTLDGVPLSDDLIDQVCAEVLPVIDAAFADLDAIPTSWVGTAEVSSEHLPVDETVYVDIGDVVVGKAMLKGLLSFLQTLQAYQLDVDYNRLIHPVDGPVASITVDGQTNDWASVPFQLLGAEEDEIKSVRVARDTENVYVLVEHRNPDACNYTWMDGELTLGIDSSVSWVYSYWDESNVSWSETGFETEITEMVFSNGVFEARFEIPDGISVANVSAETIWTDWNADFRWDSCELESPGNIPVNTLLEGNPGLLASVQSSDLMLAASNDLKTAIGYIRQADSLITNRTDGLLNFIEYDALYTNERAQLFAGLDDVETSLYQPVAWTPSDHDASPTEFDGTEIHLGEFYNAPYLTRAMLPQFSDSALLGDEPVLNSFLDPTFGGIFPGLTQLNLANLQVGLPFDLILNAPEAVSISTEQWPSKIQINWGEIDGADTYEIYRSLTSDVADAELISTTGSSSYVDSGLEKETAYYYWVRAVNAAGSGDLSSVPMAGTTSANFAMPWLNLLLE